MKECPECKRIYHDETLNYCLDDGSELVYGPKSDAPSNAHPLPGAPPSESPTRKFISNTDNPRVLSNSPLDQRETKPSILNQKPWFLPVIIIALALPTAFLLYRYSTNTGGKQIASIAVLPFQNLSGNPDLDYLADGVSESVIDRLSQLPQLKVIARGSSFRYRGPNVDLGDVATTLGVDAVVTGRLVPRGDNYDVRVELIDARDNRQLWGDHFSRKVSELQVLQSDIASAIAENLRFRLSGDQTRSLSSQGTANPEAYELLLKGRFFHNNPSRANFRKAVECYEQAVVADPKYALAYAELAVELNLIASNPLGVEDQKDLRERAAVAAQKALELDENLAESHRAAATVYFTQWRFTECEKEYKRAIELNPGLRDTHGGYANYLSLVKRDEEAIAEARRAVEIDPLLRFWKRGLAVVLGRAGKHDEAVDILKQLTAVMDNGVVYTSLGNEFYGEGRYPEALAEYQKAMVAKEDGLPEVEALVGMVYAKTGERTKAEEILRKLKAANANPRTLVPLYGELGQFDEAFAILEKLFAQRDTFLLGIERNPVYSSLRGDPRFFSLVQKIGLPG